MMTAASQKQRVQAAFMSGGNFHVERGQNPLNQRGYAPKVVVGGVTRETPDDRKVQERATRYPKDTILLSSTVPWPTIYTIPVQDIVKDMYVDNCPLCP